MNTASKWVGIFVVAVIITGVVIILAHNQPTPQTNYTTPAPTSTSPPVTNTIQMRVNGAGFTPDFITTHRFDEVVIHIQSTDGQTYGFSLPAYHIEKRITPGPGVTIQFNASTRGRFVFYNDITNGVSINGTLLVI